MSKTLEEFMARHPDLADKDTIPETVEEHPGAVRLTVIVLAVNEEEVAFGHLGRMFVVARQDVLTIEESSEGVPNPFGKGITASIAIKSTAKLIERRIVAASQLWEGIPFAIARPSQVPTINFPPHTPKELAWFEAQGIVVPKSPNMAAGTYCGHNTTSPKWSGTNCTTWTNGVSDDNNQDDGQSDEYYGDDATQDD